jgi:hypothetical protein
MMQGLSLLHGWDFVSDAGSLSLAHRGGAWRHREGIRQVIRSEVVQRWAAAGWLLKCAKTPTGAAGVKLALFYDWLFFTNGADRNILEGWLEVEVGVKGLGG